MTTTTILLTIISLLGTVLITKQEKRGFILWAIANTGWIVVDYQAGVYAQAFLFAVNLVLAVWGYVRWQPVAEVKHAES